MKVDFDFERNVYEVTTDDGVKSVFKTSSEAMMYIAGYEAGRKLRKHYRRIEQSTTKDI